MKKWKTIGVNRGYLMVGNAVEKCVIRSGKHKLFASLKLNQFFIQSFALRIRRDLHWVLHNISTLTIDLSFYFFNLITEGEVKFEIIFDFINTVHNRGVVFDANFGSDFGGTHG